MVGNFPNIAAVARLILVEQFDEGQVAAGRYFGAESLAQLEREGHR